MGTADIDRQKFNAGDWSTDDESLWVKRVLGCHASRTQSEKRQLLWLMRYSSTELLLATQRFLTYRGLWMSRAVGTDLEHDIFGSSCRL